MGVDEVLREFRPVNFAMKSAIYVWGYNHCGQTARKGKDCHLRIPKQLSPKLFNASGGKNLRWLDVACGREHTAAVATDGSLYTWGSNDYGQLGDGTEESAKHPTKVKLLQTEFVKSVSCGAHCTAAIAEPQENDGSISTGRLWVWGQNQGSNYPRLYWGAFSPNTIICQVSCGAAHTVALSDEGLVQAWGYNEHGQLGRGFTCEGLQGSRVLNAYGKFLDEAPELVKIRQVSCGEYHTAAISEDGELIYGWGYNNYGQAANEKSTYAWFPSPVDWWVGEVTRLAAGGGHSVVITDACTLKELCEFRLAENVTKSNSWLIEDVASRTGSDALARLCERLREDWLEKGDCYLGEAMGENQKHG